MHIAAERLDRYGIPLAANEVQYSLFHRDPERNGILDACRKLDVALIAYRPLAGGRAIQDASPIGRTLGAVARAHQKTVRQVALNWLLSKDERIIAIPGATNAEHVRENVGAVGWMLGDDELAAVERSPA
jgi:aryl-alcohol dehydrogenase-like predicted oxidoreductase